MKYINFLFIGIFILSCNSNSKRSFSKEGVSLKCNSDWLITEEDSFGGNGYYLSVEKNGYGESGILTLSYIDGQIDKKEFLLSSQEDLKENIVYKSGNLKFEKTIETKYANNDAIASKFSLSLLGMKHEGIIIVLMGKIK